GERLADEPNWHAAGDRLLERDRLEVDVQDLSGAGIALHRLQQRGFRATIEGDSDHARASTLREQTVERSRGRLNRARGAVAINVGRDDALAAQSPDVFAEHLAWLGCQLQLRRHTCR